MKALKILIVLAFIGTLITLANSCRQQSEQKKGSAYEKVDENSNTVTDVDGNVYRTVKIGTQVWMSENLKTTNYNDGTSIPLVTEGTVWANLSTPGYCWYNNDASNYKATYGALYNWYPVNSGKLCPKGWHVPLDAEWTILTAYLGGQSLAGGKLKEKGTTHWQSPNTGATNESGFTALPGCGRVANGTFCLIGGYGGWWSLSEHSETTAYGRDVGYSNSGINKYYDSKRSGFSIRCLRD
jgi:uncharacterized protein (TIGR02145 family)